MTLRPAARVAVDQQVRAQRDVGVARPVPRQRLEVDGVVVVCLVVVRRDRHAHRRAPVPGGDDDRGARVALYQVADNVRRRTAVDEHPCD
jgi:hypothetical protein